jgi:hypothetical protein
MRKVKKKIVIKKHPPLPRTPSAGRIFQGDIPLPDNNYCPFPAEVWPQVNRSFYYRAINNIVAGILNGSPALHLEGLKKLFTMGEGYGAHVKRTYPSVSVKNFYYAARSGTGRFQGSTLWVHRKLFDNKDKPAYNDSTEMLAVVAAEEVSPKTCAGPDQSQWRQVQYFVKEFCKVKGIVTLGDFSRSVFKEFLTEGRMDKQCRGALNEIVSGYECRMKDIWRVSEFLDSYDKGLAGKNSSALQANKKFAFWIGNNHDLGKLLQIWANPDNPVIACNPEDFFSRMRGNADGVPLIVWLADAQDLAYWIGRLSNNRRIILQQWRHVSSVFRLNDDNDDAELQTPPLRAAYGKKKKAESWPKILKICDKEFPICPVKK